jgi:hypothetical protein
MVAVIKKLWDVAWDLWEQHNGFLHDVEYQDILHNMTSIDAEIKFQFHEGVHNFHRECAISSTAASQIF